MNRALSSLAILKINWDELRKDYLENFIPFLATLIKKKDYRQIDVNTICSDFKEEFGLIIPYHPMLSILNRSKKRGIIRQEQKVFYQNKDEIGKYDFSDRSKEQLSKHEKIIDKFIDFSKEVYKTDLTKDEANSAFIACLKRHDAEILFAARDSTILPEVKSSSTLNFLAYKFIKNIHESNREYFKFIENMAIGHMISAPLLYDDFKKFKGKLNGLDIYLDTGIIFRLLGFEDRFRKAAYYDLINTFLEQKCNLNIFRHTIDEIKDNLNYCQFWIDNPKYDPSLASPILRYFRQENYTQSDIDRIIINLEDRLKRYKIKIKDAPTPNEYQNFQIDEEKLYQYITDLYKENVPNYDIEKKEPVIMRDIKSINAISKYRRGKYPTSINNTGSIFVTTNSSLAYVNKKFEKSQAEFINIIPSCVTDIFLGTLVWIQSPAKFHGIYEKKIIADCYAALEPSELLLKRYMVELEKLKSEGKINDEEHYLLRTHRTALNLLQELTLADHENFTDKTPEEILEEIKREIKIESEQKYLEEKERREEDLLKINELEKKTKKIENRAEQIAKVIALIISGILISLFILGTLSQLFTNFPKNNVVRIAFIVFTLLFGLFGTATGLNIKGLRDKVKNKIKRKIIKYLVE